MKCITDQRATRLVPSASLRDEALPPGHQFMIDLLVSSLMADRGLESALVAAISSELQDRTTSPSLFKLGAESSVPLLQLVQQLISNSTNRKMALLKQVS